jgi:murein DD-endopeptidase MepM/ murein hydrolase activator NlpD
MTYRQTAIAVAGAAAAAGAALSARIRRAGRPGPLRPADAILVFGAAVWPSGPSLSLEVRVERAAQAYADGLAPVILCSGGWSGGASEASVMRRMLVERGVPAEAIIPDDEGTTTREALRSARRFGAGNWTRVVAVSSPYHMHRIRSEARRQGLDVILCPAPRPGPRTPRLLAFDLRQHVREVLAVPAYAAGALLERRRARAARALLAKPASRVRSLLGELDAIADTSEAITARIKEGAGGFSESDIALSPAAAALIWPARGPVTSRFGLRYRRLHPGIDIGSDHASPVRASATGRVLHAGRLGPLGNVAVVDHGEGLATVYAHLGGLVVEEAETVERGDTIGFVGATGKSFGPHLHFEVRVHGTPVDPLTYLDHNPR